MRELLTDDMDIRDTKLSMIVGGNGDYYLSLKETRRTGKIIKLECIQIHLVLVPIFLI
jgi:hypothetical protein